MRCLAPVVPIAPTTTVILALAAVAPAAADLQLPPHLASHMVVQQDVPIVLTGRADPGASVSAEFAGVRATVEAERDGRFRLVLPPVDASFESRSLVVLSGADRVELRDVLVGEVWLCSGQSNMQWTVAASDRLEAVRAGADRPAIRTFNARQVAAELPQDAVPGQWLVCSPATVDDFSAVAYHFGRHLADELDVPIGLVHSSWGGSRSEAWTSPAALASTPAGRQLVAAWEAMQEVVEPPAEDFVGPDVDDSDWARGPVPGLTSAFGVRDAVDGVFWQRIPVTIPARWAGRDLRLSLGVIDDEDVTYFGRTRVGATQGWQTPRRYTVSGARVTAGDTVIAIRIRDTGGPGGLHGDPADHFMHPVDAPDDRVAITGPARLTVAAELREIPVQHRPAQLYHAMIHPLLEVPIAGVIWYQGESNGMGPGSAAEYAELLPLLIGDWRAAFAEPELPFLIAQIANLAYRVPDWDFPGVREVQRRMLELPATGLAVTTDIGDPEDIHPRNKHDVGDRLARWALVDVYGVTGVVKCGPLVRAAGQGMSGGPVIVQFDTFGSPVRGGEDRRVGGFELAGPDGRFVPVAATIAGPERVQLTVPGDLGRPTRVRYAWAPDPVGADLVNAAGLPAAAFEVPVVVGTAADASEGRDGPD